MRLVVLSVAPGLAFVPSPLSLLFWSPPWPGAPLRLVSGKGCRGGRPWGARTAQEARPRAGVRPPGTGWTCWAGGLSTDEPEGRPACPCSAAGTPCQAALPARPRLCTQGGCPASTARARGGRLRYGRGAPPMGPPRAVEASTSGPQGLSEQTVLSWVTPRPEPQPHPPGELAFLPGTPGPEAPTEGWVGGAWSGDGHRTNTDT